MLLHVPDHTARLIGARFDLDPLYPDRRLAAWSHMLGFRGHFSTKSRSYSTTLGALRQTRADYRAAQEREARGLDDIEPDSVLVLVSWQYAGHGRSPGESVLAATRRPRYPAQPRDRPRSPEGGAAWLIDTCPSSRSPSCSGPP